MVLSTIASKSVAWLRALALASGAGLAPAVSAPTLSSSRIFLCGRLVAALAANAPNGVPVCPARAGMPAISHHLDVGLDGAGGLDRLQDRDHVERSDAERIEPVDELLQRYAFLDHRELLAVLLHSDTGARHDDGAAARERGRLAHLRSF